MSLNQKQINDENQYLQLVCQIIKNNIHMLNNRLLDESNDIIQLKKDILSEGRAMSDLEYGAMLANADFQVGFANKTALSLLRYDKMLNSPYFGRIDFKMDSNPICVYIGISGLIDNDKNYIFDWRAPISSLFYNYDFGKAEYESPSGMISGEITLRRQYKIENGILKRVIENDINIDDEMLQDVLSKNSDSKMKNIVSTIQREQNQIIRNLSDKYLIVQGIAGSGKTAVAMHRIAYLLYREKELKYNNIVIFSPNDVFSEYISSILPELGERNVLNYTFNSFCSNYCKSFKNVENLSSFLDRCYGDTNQEHQVYTKSMVDVFLNNYFQQMHFNKDIVINGILFNKQEMKNMIIVKYKNLPFLERIQKLSEYICNQVNISCKKNSKKVSNVLLSSINIDLDVKKIYKSFNQNYNNKIYYDDFIIMIYIFFEMNGYPCEHSVKHVIIDEAQDYTIIQFYILKKIFINASFTILGDICQMINPMCNYSSLLELGNVFNNSVKYIELNKTYRSSPEIIEYSNHILGNVNSSSIRKSKDLPVIVYNSTDFFENVINDLNSLKYKKFNKIAIIVKNNVELNKVYNNLIQKFPTITFKKNDISVDSVSILTSCMSKGLEFDAVIIYTDTNNKYNENERNLFYVACTRAQHQLIVYNQDYITNTSL